jgi:hypothetical protein
MAKLTAKKTPVKLLLIGNSGTGKTAALACLAKAGFKLAIADFDNGLDILQDPKILPEEYRDNIDYITFTDKLQTVGGKILPKGVPSGLPSFLKALDNWPGIGKLENLGPEYIFVLDSLSLLSTMALRYAQTVNGRAGEKLQLSDWGDAMANIENVCAVLYSDLIKCHVIVTSHISYIEKDGAPMQGYPSALGNKLPPKIPRYFNTTVQTENKPGGTKGPRRVIRTISNGLVDLKCAKLDLPAELPQETGLLTIFEAMGASPQVLEKEVKYA